MERFHSLVNMNLLIKFHANLTVTFLVCKLKVWPHGGAKRLKGWEVTKVIRIPPLKNMKIISKYGNPVMRSGGYLV